MTENKRFIEFMTQNTDDSELNCGFKNIKTGEWYYTKDSENAKKICELLNELHKENRELQRHLDVMRSGALTDDKRIKELSDENEQLKEENYELHKRLGDFKPFEEYIKEKTSKTSVNDIMGLVKTDKPTNSVELKKELYK